MRVLLLIALIGFSSLSSAVDLAKNTRIYEIGNTADGTDGFYVRTTGGSGGCTNGTVIVFPIDKAPSEAYHDRAYALALMAFSSKSTKVRIANFEDNNCRGANFINVAD